MQVYVVGFAFSNDLERVALIRKRRPPWQEGKFNGVGGHVELGEDPEDAMRREFKEEAGLHVPEWQLFVVMSDAKESWKVYFYWAITDLSGIKSMTDERVGTLDVLHIMQGRHLVIPNLYWLLPMALSYIKGGGPVLGITELEYYNSGMIQMPQEVLRRSP